MSKIKVLFFAADPLSVSPDGRTPRLLLDEDVRQIRKAVRAAEHRDALDFDLRLAARPDDLMQALNETHPQVVHFSGHGNSDGLVLASADGRRAHHVDAALLAQLFQVFRGDIRVVVLSACLSLPQAEAIAEAVGCAIGTRGSISDEAAITFGAAFYRALAFGHSVRAAYDQARTALALDHFEERECPELVTRPDVDPAQLVLIPAPGLDSGEGESPKARVPPRDDGAWEENAPLAPAARPALAARARQRVGIAAVAVAVASGIVLFDGIPTGGDSQGNPDAAKRLATAEATPGGTVCPPPAGPATASVAPGDPLSTARDLYGAGKFTDAFPRFQRAAEAGDAEAMGFLGIMYLNGEGTERNPELAVRWLRKAAEKRDARGMNALGAAAERGDGRDRSYYWAMHWYRAAAEEKGYAPAMSNLARMYRQGLGVEANPDTALAWYRKAVAAGCLDAMVDAGLIHQQGPAGARNPEEALHLFRAAAEKGSARGMVAIGMMYQEGDGVSRNYDEAKSWYLKGAEAGSADAMNNLGVLYQNGWGVRRNRATAMRWFRRAAEAGSTVAAANLAAMDTR